MSIWPWYKIKRLEGLLERERMRLAACGAVALGLYTCEPAPEYASESCSDVLNLRKRFVALTETKDADTSIWDRSGQRLTVIAVRRGQGLTSYVVDALKTEPGL